MNFISFIIKFIKFKLIIKFKKFERHNYAQNPIPLGPPSLALRHFRPRAMPM